MSNFTEAEQAELLKKTRKLPQRHYLNGPEHAGCINSGLRPILLRRGKVFLVGPQLDVEDAVSLRTVTGQKINQGQAFSWEIHHSGGNRNRTVYILQRPTAATRKFLALCDQVLDANQETRARVADLQAKANQGNLEAALTLGLEY